MVTEDQLVLLAGVLLTVGGLVATVALVPPLRHPQSPCGFVRAHGPSRGIPSITGGSGPPAETGRGVGDSGRWSGSVTGG